MYLSNWSKFIHPSFIDTLGKWERTGVEIIYLAFLQYIGLRHSNTITNMSGKPTDLNTWVSHGEGSEIPRDHWGGLHSIYSLGGGTCVGLEDLKRQVSSPHISRLLCGGLTGELQPNYAPRGGVFYWFWGLKCQSPHISSQWGKDGALHWLLHNPTVKPGVKPNRKFLTLNLTITLMV